VSGAGCLASATPMPTTPFKTCDWCGIPFDPTHWNQEYCVDHREEAKKKTSRKTSRDYYNRNKKSQILRQIGTTTMGPHPNPDEGRELEIVEKELARISVRTVYKGKQQYSKGRTVFTQLVISADEIQLGTQQTHNYASFDDYVETSVSYWMTSQGPCPECESGKHLKDFSRCECACECGLLLYGAPHPSFKYPDDNDENIPLCPFSHEVKNKELIQKWKNEEKRRQELLQKI